METEDAHLRKSRKLASSGEVNASDDGDRVTNLPEAIVHHIFSFLETIDVIRASAVSRRWRYLWTSIPYFNFNINTFGFWSEKSMYGSLQAMNESFKDFVNWVLVSQDSSVGIQKFRHSCVNLEDDHSVYRWINVKARRNLGELVLIMNSQAAFTLPLSLARCKSLKALKLNLQDSILKLPTSGGFARLKSLELARVELNDETVTGNFIRGCPFLEELSVWLCIFRDLKVLEICSSNLKKLDIDNYFLDGPRECSLCSVELKVACPNLVSFTYIRPSAKDYSLQDLSSLVYAFIFLEFCEMHTKEENWGYITCKVLKGLGHAKVLKLSDLFLEFLSVVPTIVDFSFGSLCNLRSLKFSTAIDFCYVESIFMLLECSPNLEVLTIHVLETHGSYEWKVPDKSMICLTHHLKTVELISIEGNADELELIRFLLKDGHVLQKMNITWWMNIENTKEIIQKVMEF